MKTLIIPSKIETILGLFLTFFCLSSSVMCQTITPPNEVLILGTAHLSQIKGFQRSMLENLTNRLDSLSFDVICIENMSAELLYDIRSRKDSAYADVLSYFGGNRLSVADSAQSFLGISFLEAQKKINELRVKDSLSDSERLSYIEYALAAADPVTATLNYTQLEDKETILHARLPQHYFDQIISEKESPNEIYSLALNLALKAGHSQIEYIDNFQDEALLFKHFPNFIKEYTNNASHFQGIEDLPVFKKDNAILKQGIENNDLLAYYVFLNSQEYMTQDFEAQWKIWLSTNFPSGADRGRYYLWEMRNLQIAANIAMIAAIHPGKKILVIIGSSHKSFIEKYLSQISIIKLLEFN